MNKLEEIQRMLMAEMRRLDNNEIMENKGVQEVARSNAMSQSANTLIKTINVGIRVMEISNKNNKTVNEVNKELGIIEQRLSNNEK